jgi:hypothetical protein
MIHSKTSEYKRVEELLGIEDKDFQKLILMNRGPLVYHYQQRVENDEKIGYYYRQVTTKAGNTGQIYPSSKLLQWIVYHKKTKKCSVSKDNQVVFRDMVEHKFSNSHLIHMFSGRPTATMCKKMLTGKINTIRDLLNYHRSYTFRNKKLTPEILYDAFRSQNLRFLNVIEDPENVDWKETIHTIPNELCIYKPFLLKSSEVKDGQILFNEWRGKQAKKYADLQRSRTAKLSIELTSADFPF